MMIYLNTTDVSHEQPNDLCKIEKCYDCLLKQKKIFYQNGILEIH
jgi:hypothetical protein